MSAHERLPGGKTNRHSREGFQRLSRRGGDKTLDIPMQDVSPPSKSAMTSPSSSNEKTLYHKPGQDGFQSSPRPTAPGRGPSNYGHTGGRAPQHPDEVSLNKMGVFYNKFMNISIVTRYLVYIFPLGILLAIPIIVGATAAKDATIGPPVGRGGVRIVYFFSWLLCCWVGLWVSKIFAHWLPVVFQFLCGIVSSGVRKYAMVIKALEIPLSLVGWALISLATFQPICTQTPGSPNGAKGNTPPHWVSVLERVLAAALVTSLLFLVERILVHLISIDYHRKQFDFRIKHSKHNIHLLGLLYEASRSMFPQYCPEFAEEDTVINDSIDVSQGKKKKKKSGSATPMRFVRDVGRMGDKLTSAFGNIAQEVTGKEVFNPDSAHSIVVEALEKNTSAEALAKRLWLSFVVEGHEALYEEDVREVLGENRRQEAEECFGVLDKDGNGDVSLEEMILTVIEFGRERQAIANSMHDVDQAIKVLDGLLLTAVFIAVIFIFVAFLNTNFVTTLATAGTALLSLSFVFAGTCQEVLGSCIFLFVKHPFDIGDRVELSSEHLVVEHISLLFTVFRKLKTNQLVQIPNIVLNTLWIENISRSQAMKEQLSINVDFSTTFEDIQLLKSEMAKFVTEKENSRDFFPDVEVQVLDFSDMSKLELRVEVQHKSNWANESVRASRRSKFMCALVSILRKIPMAGPGGGGATLGTADNPNYSVAISNDLATKNKEVFASKKEDGRLVSAKKKEANKELKPETPAQTPSMDRKKSGSEAWGGTNNNWTRSQAQELEEVRGLLHRENTKGRRRSGRSVEDESPDVGYGNGLSREPSAGKFPAPPPKLPHPYAPPPQTWRS